MSAPGAGAAAGAGPAADRPGTAAEIAHGARAALAADDLLYGLVLSETRRRPRE